MSIALVAMQGAAAGAEDEPGRNPREPVAGMKLPPRNGGHDATSATRKGTSASGGIWTTVVSLGVIISSLGFVAYWLRPYLGVPRGLPIDALELLGRRAIEPKVAIHLVRCGSRVLVLGVSSEGARTLSEITDPVEVRRLVEVCHAPRDPRSSPISHGDNSNNAHTASLSGHEPQPIPGARSSPSRGPSFPIEETRRG